MDATSELAPYPELTGFRLIQELGRSPKGIVFKARRLVEQDVVAVKLFREAALREAGFREGLERHAENTFLLEHRGLVRCLGCLQDQARLLLVMEYARGEPLSRALQRNVRFLPPRALAIAVQCADALRYAYERRRFHGRLHPGDVILGEEDVRILGVGLGEHPEHADWNVKDPHLFAPLIYSAPEAQPSKTPPASEEGRRAVDLYALGALLYHMLTGAPPFRATDEGSLAQERAALSPASVRWPRGADRTLPPRALQIVERFLAAEPADRGSYENAMASLEEAWREAEGKPLALPKSHAAPLLAPAETPPRPAPPPKERHEESGGARGASGAPPGASTLPALPPLRRPLETGRYYDERRGERLSTAVLIGVTALTFALAMAISAKTFLFNSAPPTPVAGSGQTTAQGPGASNPALPADPASPSPAETAAEADAAHQLELIGDMLKSGEARYNTATLRELHRIKAKTGESSRTGLKVRMLISEVEDRMAGGGERSAGPAAPAKPPSGNRDAEEKVFQELLARAKEQAAKNQFGAALTTLRELPAGLKLAPYTERAVQEAAQIEKDAAVAFAEISRTAETAVAQGDFAKARGLYQTFQLRAGLPAWEEAAASRVKTLFEAETKALQEQSALNAGKAKAQELAAFAELLKTAAEKAGTFRHNEAKDTLDAFAAKATDPEARKLAGDYAKLIQDEGLFFARCRTRLKDQIERDPNRSSPLQLFNKNNEPIADLVDFDERGITYAATKGGAGGSRLREWGSFALIQPFKMLQNLRVRENAPEHLALASVAFHLALKAEAEARKAEADAAKSASAQSLKGIAKEMRGEVQSALNAAVQTDASLREKHAAQRALMDRLSELLAAPPSPAAAPQP